MNDGGLVDRLRALPGVLDCSTAPEGLALLIHPEVDARALKARAEALCAAAGDPRPIVTVGGLVTGAVPPVRRRWLGRREAPVSLLVFAMLVVATLSVAPIHGMPVRSTTTLVAEATPGRAPGRTTPTTPTTQRRRSTAPLASGDQRLPALDSTVPDVAPPPVGDAGGSGVETLAPAGGDLPADADAGIEHADMAGGAVLAAFQSAPASSAAGGVGVGPVGASPLVSTQPAAPATLLTAEAVAAPVVSVRTAATPGHGKGKALGHTSTPPGHAAGTGRGHARRS